MNFLPFYPPLIILALAAAAIVAVWWVAPDEDAAAGRSRGPYWRRTLIVVLVAIAMLRPGVDGDDAPVASSNVNVYFVVDTTPSMLAEDYGDQQQRIAGVRSDIGKMVQAMPGARFAIITFDKSARVRVPLTADTTAIQASVETMRTEPPLYSKGSTISEAKDRLQSYLTQSMNKNSDRGRIVIYMGDGEQTAQSKPASMAMPQGLVDQAAVLGYGTSQGGPMKVGSEDSGSLKIDGQGYLLDGQGKRAQSTADENNLKQIAQQLGGDYTHRTSLDEGVDGILKGFDLAKFGESDVVKQERVAARRDFYWIPLLLAGLLGAVELGLASSTLRAARRREEGAPR